MKNIVTILGAAAALIAIADYFQRQKAAAEISGAVNMNAGASTSMRWWEQSGSPDNVMASGCRDCSNKSQWGKYGVLPPYPFS